MKTWQKAVLLSLSLCQGLLPAQALGASTPETQSLSISRAGHFGSPKGSAFTPAGEVAIAGSRALSINRSLSQVRLSQYTTRACKRRTGSDPATMGGGTPRDLSCIRGNRHGNGGGKLGLADHHHHRRLARTFNILSIGQAWTSCYATTARQDSNSGRSVHRDQTTIHRHRLAVTLAARDATNEESSQIARTSGKKHTPP
jgi:hypothetical protein